MVFANEQELKRSKIGEGLYLLYFAIMVGVRAYGLYDGQVVYNIVLVVAMGLFVAKMVVTRHTLREYVLSLFLLLFAGIVYLNTGEKGLFVCFTMMLGMKEVSVKKAVKVGAVCAGVIIMSKIFLGVFGLTSEIYYPQERDGIGLMFRHALGYAHPNTLHMNVLMLSMMVIYLFTLWLNNVARKLAVVMLLGMSLVVFAFNFYIFQYSGSRTGLLACLVYLGVNFWFFCKSRLGILEKLTGYAAFPGAGFISLVLPFLLHGKVFDFVDKTIFTTRFTIAKYFWSNNKISLFGIRLNNPNPRYATYGLDMAQLYLFLQLGIAAFVVVAILSFFYVRMCVENDLKAELAVFIGMTFLGIWEPLLYNLGFKNFTFVFMGAMLFYAFGGERKYIIDTESSQEGKDLTENSRVLEKKLKKVIGFCVISIVVGITASLIFYGTVKKPTALYGDRQEGESGDTFGMEELYFSEEEIDDIRAGGDLVVGYVDETVPLYKYSSDIAAMEYDKKAMSLGVFGGIAVMILLLGTNVVITKRIKG